MPYVTTLVAPCQAPFFEARIMAALTAHHITPITHKILAPDRAIRVTTTDTIPHATLTALRHALAVDLFHTQQTDTPYKLFFADMDATIIQGETLDELAAHAGLKDEITAITVAAMQGTLDFEGALRARVALLKGLPISALAKTAAHMALSQGAAALLTGLKAQGITCVLISGGFTFFTARVADMLGFDAHAGNTLVIENDALAGTVAMPIISRAFKAAHLVEVTTRMGLSASQTIAIGDGANDIDMLQTAGLGIGFYAKPLVQSAVPSHIQYGGLDSVLYAFNQN